MCGYEYKISCRLMFVVKVFISIARFLLFSQNVLRFWLDKGVDGFRMDAVVTMVEKEGFPDFDPNNPDNPLINQPETYQIIQEFRAVLDTYTDK